MAPPHQPGLLPPWIAKQGVNQIITGGVRSHVQALFQKNNVEFVMRAMEDDPEKAVLSYSKSVLKAGDNT